MQKLEYSFAKLRHLTEKLFLTGRKGKEHERQQYKYLNNVRRTGKDLKAVGL
jgi:hypothetical protein